MQTSILTQLTHLSSLVAGPQQRPLLVVAQVESKDNQPPRLKPRLATWQDGQLRYLTQEEARDPQWAGGYVYFTRKVDQVSQLFRLSLEGGEPEMLTQFAAGVEGYRVSPDGLKIALLSRGDTPPARNDLPRVYQVWPHKFDGRGLLPTAPLSLYLWQAGQVRLLHQSSQDISEVAWGGEFLIFTSAASAQNGWQWKQTAYLLDAQGQTQVWFGGEGPITGLAATPDGLGMVYLAHAWERAGGSEASLFFRSWSGEVRLLVQGSLGPSTNSDQRIGGFDGGPRFGPDGRVYLIENYQGTSRLLAVSLQGQCEVVSPAQLGVAAFAFCGTDLWWLSESHGHAPRLEGPQVSFDPNVAVLGQLPTPQTVQWQSPEGHSVAGWLLLPEGPGPHPVILSIHGGPHTAYGNALMLEFHLFQAAGYAVAYCNPRGSTGYGLDFTPLGGRWGDIDEADLLGFLDHCLQSFPLDRQRQAVAGGSYGGYMTNWLTARHPSRFRAAVTDRCISNWTSFWGASDIGPRFSGLELEGSPWENPEILWQKSPLRLVHQVQTPTLVVHSENDHRCPIDQGETWYTALLQRGVPTRFFRVPEEGHELSRSGRTDRRMARLEAYLAWWKEYL